MSTSGARRSRAAMSAAASRPRAPAAPRAPPAAVMSTTYGPGEARPRLRQGGARAVGHHGAGRRGWRPPPPAPAHRRGHGPARPAHSAPPPVPLRRWRDRWWYGSSAGGVGAGDEAASHVNVGAGPPAGRGRRPSACPLRLRRGRPPHQSTGPSRGAGATCLAPRSCHPRAFPPHGAGDGNVAGHGHPHQIGPLAGRDLAAVRQLGGVPPGSW